MAGLGGGFVVQQSRLLDAPVEHVFGLLTGPAELSRWWGPHGFTMPEVQVDLRVGGGFRFTMQPPDGESFHLSGTFRAIEFPSRLEFTFRWDEPTPDDRETVVELALDSLAEGTNVRLTHGEFATAERLELHRQGWAESFERLDAVIKVD